MNANFDINDKSKYPALDISFIPGLVLDMAGLNGDSFYKANSLMRKKCNGMLESCAGQDKNTDKILESYKSLTVQQLGF